MNTAVADVQTEANSKTLELSNYSVGDRDCEKVTTSSQEDRLVFLVAFAEPTDYANPKDWSSVQKWLVTSVLSASGFTRIMVSTIMAPALGVIATELHMNSVETVMAMTVYLLATAFGPLFIGPLSEVHGRKSILHATNLWFLLWNLVCGFAHTKGLLIAARLFAGLGASAVYALGGGVLGDVWRPEQRGRSLGLYLLIPLLAVAVGPIVGGYITQHISWRWLFWSTTCVQVVMEAFALVFFKETHGPTILRNRAKSLRHSNNTNRFYTAEEKLDEGRSAYQVLRRSLTRPIRLLLFHPIVQIQACLSGFSYGITYLVLSNFSELWTSNYDESISSSSLHYLAICLGELAGAELTGPLMDIIFRRLKTRAEGATVPEYHIPLMIPGAVLTPLGMFMYGWAAEKHAFWFIVDLGVFILCFGMQMAGQALQAYVIDSYSDHTSSASAASQFVRSLTAFGFPLFAPRMYSALGYGWGNTLLGLVGVAINLPAPILLWFYGARLRAKATSSY